MDDVTKIRKKIRKMVKVITENLRASHHTNNNYTNTGTWRNSDNFCIQTHMLMSTDAVQLHHWLVLVLSQTLGNITYLSMRNVGGKTPTSLNFPRF